jgi:hypothetical protein
MVNAYEGVKKRKNLHGNVVDEEPEISEEYKKKLVKIRDEVKKGKATKYKDVKHLARDIGL